MLLEEHWLAVPCCPPPVRALPHPVTFQVKTAAFSSRPCLRSNLLRDHEPRHRRRPSTPGVRDQPADPRRRTRQGAVSPSRPRWRRRRLAPGRPCPHPTEQIWSSMPSWRREGVCWAQPDDGSRLVAVPDGSRAWPPMPDSRCAVDPRRTGAATGLADRAVAELTCRYASSDPAPAGHHHLWLLPRLQIRSWQMTAWGRPMWLTTAA
jgi:hypothetical protein